MTLPFRHESHAFTRDLRDLLVEHLDGAEIDLNAVAPKSRRRRLFTVLAQFGMIAIASRRSVITDRGREALARMLADYAETMVRADAAARRATSTERQYRPQESAAAPMDIAAG